MKDDALARALARRNQGWLPVLECIGSGLDSVVYRAEHPRWGPVAIKCPRQRASYNENDGWVDGRRLLDKEQVCTDLVRKAGIPAPAIFDMVIDSEEPDYIVVEYVESDGSAPEAGEFGRVLSGLHRGTRGLAPDAHPYLFKPSSVISETIQRRTQRVEALTGLSFSTRKTREYMASVLDGSDFPTAVVHMDYRPANLIARSGRIHAIVDWSNAFVGDPAIEIARIDESCLASEKFYEEYGSNILLERQDTLQIVYRLYTSTMLSLVFLSEAPDDSLARKHLARMSHLYDALNLDLLRRSVR